MATGDKLVTVAQAARYLGITPQGPTLTGSKLITMGQLKSAVDGSAPSGGEKLVTLSQLKRVQTLKIVSWADGTDEEIAAMVAAADAGQIDLSDYWHEGDMRTVHLSAMPAMAVGESHAAQSVQFVLSDPGHFTLSSGQPCNFVVNMKDCLKEVGYMNFSNTNSGGWNGCARRTWCNNVFRDAIPSGLRPAFKQFKTKAATGVGEASTTSTDWFALPSEMEVFGSVTYANSSAESGNTQLNYYKTSSNRVKKMNGVADGWWERSPDGAFLPSFCVVVNNGNAYIDYASNRTGISPFGCI